MEHAAGWTHMPLDRKASSDMERLPHLFRHDSLQTELYAHKLSLLLSARWLANRNAAERTSHEPVRGWLQPGN